MLIMATYPLVNIPTAVLAASSRISETLINTKMPIEVPCFHLFTFVREQKASRTI